MRLLSMKRHYYYLVILAITFYACSSLPSESLIRRDIEDKIQQAAGPNAKPGIRVSSFRKVNGYNPIATQYTMDYEGQIEFESDGWWIRPFTFSNSDPEPGRPVRDSVFVRKGQTANFTGSVFLVKSENGWQAMPQTPTFH